MKKLLLIAACLIATPAHAYEHGRGWGGRWFGPALVGGVVGYELAYPYPYRYPYYPYYPGPYYPDPYYYPPYVVATPPATTVAPQQPAPVWYYCESQKAYYPYVNSCAEGWKEVPAIPPPGAPH